MRYSTCRRLKPARLRWRSHRSLPRESQAEGLCCWGRLGRERWTVDAPSPLSRCPSTKAQSSARLVAWNSSASAESLCNSTIPTGGKDKRAKTVRQALLQFVFQRLGSGSGNGPARESWPVELIGGVDGARTRDPRRDRPV